MFSTSIGHIHWKLRIPLHISIPCLSYVTYFFSLPICCVLICFASHTVFLWFFKLLRFPNCNFLYTSFVHNIYDISNYTLPQLLEFFIYFVNILLCLLMYCHYSKYAWCHYKLDGRLKANFLALWTKMKPIREKDSLILCLVRIYWVMVGVDIRKCTSGNFGCGLKGTFIKGF